MPISRLLRGHSAQPFAFGALDDAPAAAAFVPFPALDAPSPEADGALDFVAFEAPPAPPRPQAPEVAEAAAAAFEAGREAGLADRADEVAALQAEAERLEEALAHCRAAAEKRAAFADRAAERLHDAWARACHAMQTPLAALAIETAEAVLDAPLSAEQRAATEAALSAAVDTLAATAPVTVTLHPVDLLHLQETGLATAIETTHPGLRWTPDTTLDEGDWSVTTAEAAVRRIRTDMLAALRGRLHLDA